MSSQDASEKEILNDIRTYQRITAAAALRATAVRVFDSWEKAAAYSKMDGKTSTYQIADSLQLPQRTVANWADDFVRAMLASPPDDFHKSHRALFSLGELSVDLAQLKKKKKTISAPTQSAIPASTLDASSLTTSIAESTPPTKEASP